MLRRRDVHLYLAIRLGPPDTPAGMPAAYRDLLGRLPGTEGHPLHWVLPPGVFEPHEPTRRGELAAQLRERLGHGDRLVATGHRGALHPLLSLRHVRQDLAWALRNPWRCGIVDVLGREPVAVYPPCPDWKRPGVVPLYRELGLGLVIADWPAQARGPYVFHQTEGNLVVVWALHATSETSIAVRSALRARTRALLLVVDPHALEDGQTLAVLADLMARYRLIPRALPDLPQDSPPVPQTGPADGEPGCLPSTPGARRSWAGVASLGSSRKNDDALSILEAYARDLREEGSPIPIGSHPPARRAPSSAMPGVVTLPGATFDARFRDGVLCAFHRPGQTTSPIGASVICLRHGPRALHATVESATSFEDGDARGLRSVLTLSGGRIVADAWFPAGRSFLALEILARYPSDPGLAHLVPFGLTVDMGPRTADGQPTATLICRSPAGQPTEHILRSPRRGERTGVAAGSSFTIRCQTGVLTLAFPSARGPATRTLPWRLYSSGKTHTLELNPMGTYRRHEAALYTGIRERMTFLLCPEADPPEPAAGAPRELQPDLIERV